MKTLNIVLIIVGILALLIVMFGGASVYFANRYVQSPAFKEQVLAAARQQLLEKGLQKLLK